MGLSSTLFTGLSGLDVNQTRLNVVGNNIANVNTVAFKSSRALFKPQFYVTDSAGGPADADFGGTNPSQRGLGAVVASIETNFTPGSLETTGKSTDMAIDGNGFFVVQGKQQAYTRDGSFSLNQNNTLVTANGDFVQGFGVDAAGSIIPGQLKNIVIPKGLTQAKASENVLFAGNLDADTNYSTSGTVLQTDSFTNINGSASPQLTDNLIDLRQIGPGNTLTQVFHTGDVLTLKDASSANLTLPTLTLNVTATTTVQDMANFLQQGYGLDTSAAITGAPTPGVTLGAAAGDPANTARFLINGNAGQAEVLSAGTLSLTTGNTASAAINVTTANAPSTAVGEGTSTQITVYDSLGNPLQVNVSFALVGPTSPAGGGTTWQFIARSVGDTDSSSFDPTNPSQGVVVGEGTVSFDNAGQYVSAANNTIQVTRLNTGAGTPVSIKLDFSSMNAINGKEDQIISKADGKPIGKLTDFSVDTNGVVTGLFDNGLNTTLGQIAIASFSNPNGLDNKGGGLYVTGASSGSPLIGTPGEGDAGLIRSGSLEQSNVDLSAEFINMIVASTGFSAASRVITTSDQLIQDLLNAQR